MDGSWQLWPSNHSCQLSSKQSFSEQGRVRSMRSKALSCKLLPGVVWLHPWVHAEILSYLHTYTNTGYGRWIHTVKVTRVAYAPTYADNGIQSSSEETRQQRGRALPPWL
ncbi:unnamed protein product [Urochloa decumbens]|uniref:Uncharacterized protein n=1 Tax=Urochloa decumbens TaxID=240449 RepID=A0ABC8Y4S0_9POAL